MVQFRASVDYHLEAPLGATDRCTCYRANTSEKSPVEIRVLSASLCQATEWPALVKRLKLVSTLQHVAVRRVLDVALDHDPPFVAVELIEGETVAEAVARTPFTFTKAFALGQRLADAISAAHRLGVVHGAIDPTTVVARALGEWTLDLTGLAIPIPGTMPDLTRQQFVASEIVSEGIPELASDVYSLGAVVQWLLQGNSDSQPLAPELQVLLQSCLASEPGERPTAGQLAWKLAAFAEESREARDESNTLAQTFGEEETPAPPGLVQTILKESPETAGRRLGRFELTEKLGEGGMGTVFRARDIADQATVAIKVLNERLAKNVDSRRRFAKEARLLARVNNPFVANLLEFNDDGGVHYLAVEFVPGGTVAGLLRQRKKLDEGAALAIVADAARGLAVAHQRGVIHRDIKPDNLLLTTVGHDFLYSTEASDPPAGPLVKLSDFGLARGEQQSESLAITRAGAVLGTPLYMSPEQCRGTAVDARSDVYSLGATFFHLLAGRPPFDGDSHVAVLNKHCHEPPPSLKQIRPDASEATIHVVEKCLSKNPDARYADAAELLADVEKLLTGEPTSMLAHPAMPDTHSSEVLEFTFSCDLESSPAQLWPYVSNTDRVNHALGLPSVRYTTRVDPERGVERFAEAKIAGQTIRWQEHPYEWIEGRRMSVLREFSVGPFAWFINVVELQPRAGGGTRVSQTLKVTPKNWLGRWLAKWELGRKSPRAFTRVYQGIDKYLTLGATRDTSADAFGKRSILSTTQKVQLQQRLERLREQTIEPTVVETLGQFLEHASDLEVARIRPLAFAEQFRLDPKQVVTACLAGAREGLLVLLWDILCPSCRIPADVQETLAALKDHGYCPACDLRYEIDFANSVEMIFRAHPELRVVETRTYCIGGPAFSAHVVAQTRLAAGERFALELKLGEGIYRVRGPQLPFAVDLRVSPQGVVGRWDLPLHRPPLPDSIPMLRASSQVITLVNDTPRDLQVRLERTAGRQLAFTAADASALPQFRELFPDQILSPGQIVSITTVTLFLAQIHQAAALYENLGDGPAFGQIRTQLTRLDDVVRKNGGAVVKTVGEGVVATFAEPAAAIRTAIELLSPAKDSLSWQIAIHRGPAMVTTLNDRLDYFGGTANRVRELLGMAGPSELLLTEAVAAQPEVAQLMRERKVDADLLASANGNLQSIIHRWRMPGG